MRLISKSDIGTCFSLCVFDIFSKHAWILPLKGNKGVTINKAFRTNLIANKLKLGWIKGVIFTVGQGNIVCRIMII